MKRIVPKLLNGLLFILGVVYVGGSLYFANVLINRDTQPLAVSQERMADYVAGLPTPESVAIEAEAVTLAGFYYENPADGRCAALLLHGYTSTRYTTLQFAPLFWEKGCHLLAYDARGHGESTDAYHTYGYYEKEDGAVAYEWLLAKSGLPPEKVGILGISYGAATALQMVPLVPDAAFVVADSPYQDLRTIVGHQAAAQFGEWTRPFLPGAFFVAQLRSGLNVDAVSPITAVANTTIPILLIHAQADTFTSPNHSRAIYSRSNQAITELHITSFGSEHGLSVIDDYAAYKAIVDAFLADKAPNFAAGGR